MHRYCRLASPKPSPKPSSTHIGHIGQVFVSSPIGWNGSYLKIEQYKWW